ncbi:hypothetical protein CCY97_04830 [Helicobacter sp. 10-6591]|nr:hypothetical protein CCY97_04830 [Helicobacter sp. 10-6591]
MFFVCNLHFLFCIAPIDFKVYDMQGAQSGHNVLIMSGIQGDEPGAYNATNLFLQYYTIKKGSVRVIPVLSPHSMYYNSRGIYGDLNRKFATLSKRDPEFGVIQKIKEQILKAEIQAVFHMHDGSGFYREQYINETFNPKRWGNCSIIDQDSINVEPFGNLKEIVEQIVAHTNTGLLKSFHKYHIHNTHTAIKDKQMQKSLTYFAITNGKPAFAHEASKTLPLRERVYYHLLGIEGFLQAVGVEFERNFDLTPKTIASLINDKNLTLTIDSSITIPLFHLKSPINFFPIPLSAKGDVQNLALESKSYILGLSPEGDFKADSMVFLKYGNRTMARIKPLYLEFDKSLEHIDIQVDGKRQEVKIGSILKVKDNFYLHNKDGYRANVIGFIKPNDIAKKPQEFDVLVQKKAMLKKFALDINAKLYRVEFYKGNAFSGMILVEFE